ncbi:MAG: hypothetical protein ACI9M9_002334 [Flavobacteriaceae bacterium]
MKTTKYINQIQNEIEGVEHIAVKNKQGFLLVAFGGLVYAMLYISPYLPTSEDKEWVTIMYRVFFTFTFFVPLIFTPLHYFLSNRKLNTLNYNLKNKLIKQELKPYNTQLKYYPIGSINEYIVFKLGLINKGLKGAYGDDFLIGYFNKRKIQFSEYHITTFFTRIFDGFLVKVEQSPYTTDFTYYDEMFAKHIKRSAKKQLVLQNIPPEILNNTEILFAKQTKGKLYIGIDGHKNMLEYSFKKIALNHQKLEKDVHVLKRTLKIVNDITGKS